MHFLKTFRIFAVLFSLIIFTTAYSKTPESTNNEATIEATFMPTKPSSVLGQFISCRSTFATCTIILRNSSLNQGIITIKNTSPISATNIKAYFPVGWIGLRNVSICETLAPAGTPGGLDSCSVIIDATGTDPYDQALANVHGDNTNQVPFYLSVD